MNPVIQALESEVQRLETAAAAVIAKINSMAGGASAADMQAVAVLTGRVKTAVDSLTAVSSPA